MQISPELRAKFRRFRSDKRAWYSLLVLLVLFLITLPAELLCNYRPLFISWNGSWYIPAIVRYSEKDFGGIRTVEPDYRSSRFLELVNVETPESKQQEQKASDSKPNSPADEILSILDDFDEESDEMTPEYTGRLDDILLDFDPEPGDVELAEQKHVSPVSSDPAFILWPPIRYDFAYIPMSEGRTVLLSPWERTLPNTGEFQKAGWKSGHLLGTDDRGRDVLARLIYGFRVSLIFGMMVALSSTIIGTIFGAVQGYFAGWIDLIGQRMMEIWGSMPQLYLLIIISSLIARNILTLFVILNLTAWMGLSAYIRAEFLRNRNLDYVRAAKALGASSFTVMRKHVLPNSLIPIITFFPFSVTSGILALVSLDFLALGVPSPYPSIGEMLSQGQKNLHAIWIIIPTALLLSISLTLLTFIGDGVRKAFDPKRG